MDNISFPRSRSYSVHIYIEGDIRKAFVNETAKWNNENHWLLKILAGMIASKCSYVYWMSNEYM